jgi:pimeloyl-ACP methyl ester carboxylesterase
MPDETSIRPFRIEIPQADVDDLRERLGRTRWPRELSGLGWSRGVPLDHLRALAEHWASGFDWRRQEAALNELPQFITTVDGQDVHFVHVRSGRPGALPLLMLHGWPSSPFEFARVIEPLTAGADAFDLVIPSLPGYGFSTPVRETGWGNLFRVAQAFAELMRRLGYDRYAVQGTDVGTGVAGILGAIDAGRVAGVHLSGTVAAMPFGPPLALDGLSGTDRARAERFNELRATGLGYLHLQSTRPQTLAYALADSPVAQLAWIADCFHAWTDRALDAIDRDRLLTNVSIFWFTGAGPSSAHAICDGMEAWRAMADQAEAGEAPQAGPPTGVAVFAADTTIRSVMDPAGRIRHWSEFERGGHFAAMEVPDLLAADLRTFFAELR